MDPQLNDTPDDKKNLEQAPPATPPAPAAAPLQRQGSKALAVTGMSLGIAAVLLSVLWPIAALLALSGLFISIVALVKKHAGTGLSITGLATSGATLLIFVPFWAALTLTVWGGINHAKTQVDKSIEQERRLQENQKRSVPGEEQQSNASEVNTSCFSYRLPSYYTDKKVTESTCTTAVNIKDGDSLTAIGVKASGRTDSTDPAVIKEDVKQELAASKLGEPTFVDKTIGSNAVIVATFKDSFKLDYSMYIVVDPKKSHIIQGKTISTYYITGYAYNSSLRNNVESVVKSFTLA